MNGPVSPPPSPRPCPESDSAGPARAPHSLPRRPAQRGSEWPDLGVLVLAAGKSTRLASVTGGLPKPLLQIQGKTLLDWTLEWLVAAGVRSVWINLYHQPQAVLEALGNGSRHGLRIHYSLEPKLMGTAGAWKRLEDEWRGTTLVVYGDNLMRFDLARFLSRHRSTPALATVAVFDPSEHVNTDIAGGSARVDAGNRITGFREHRDLVLDRAGEVERAAGQAAGERGRKTAPGPAVPARGHATSVLVNAGAYLLEPEVVRWIGNGPQDFGGDVFPSLAPTGRLYAHRLEPSGFCLGVDTPERLAMAQGYLNRGEVSL